MAFSKITLNGETLMDVTITTATANTIVSGSGAVGADGIWMDGSLINGNNLEYGLTDGSLPLSGVAKSDLAELEE